MSSEPVGSARKRVTAADVARSLGLSRATVGFVLNDTPGQTISEATRQRVLAEAKRLGYRPHTAARALASGRSHIVLLVLPEWPLDYSMRRHLDEASAVLDRAGYSLVPMTPHPDGQAAPLWETLSPDVVMALAPLPDSDYDAIRDTGAIAIIPGRDDSATERDLHFAEGPRIQVEHLLERGSKRIAFAGSSDERLVDLSAQRLQLAERTHRELTGAPLAATAQLDDVTAPGIVERWLAAGIDGVVAYNDDVAAMVLAAALRLGVAVPDQLAIVGHDDTPLARYLVPSLSTIGVDTAGLGRFVAELALSAVTGSPPPTAEPATSAHLVRRETS